MKRFYVLLFIFTFIISLTLTSFKVSASSYGVNLASPDLTDKEYLHNGVYRLYDNNGITIDYNVYNGFWLLNGTATRQFIIGFTNDITIGLLTAQMLEISGTASNSFSGWSFGSSTVGAGRIYFNNSNNVSKTKTFEKTISFSNLRFDISNGTIFINYQFKLQLEKGDTATPYQIPMGAFRQHQELIAGDMPNNLFQTIYDLLKDFIQAVSGVWKWLNDPIKIGLDLGVIGYIGLPPFTPISVFGVGILVVIGFWAIKSLLPLG